MRAADVEGLACIIQPQWFDRLERVPADVGNRILGALVRAFYTGESQAERFADDDMQWALYGSLEDQLMSIRAAAISGRDGGRKSAAKRAAMDAGKAPSKGGSEGPAKAPADKNKNKNKEKKVATATQKDGGGGEALKSLLRSWNEVTGANMRSWPKRARDGILDALEHGRTIADLERCIELSLEWEPRYRTPTGVFADGRVEQWLNRPAGKPATAREWPAESPCPSCGGAGSLQTPGIYRCAACGAVFKGAV